MKMMQKNFFVAYLLLGLFTALLSVGIDRYVISFIDRVAHYWVVFLFLYIITLIAYIASYIGIKNGGQVSALSILGGMMVKLLFAMAFALVYIKKNSDNQMVFAFGYFSLYLLFSAFEVIGLLSNLRHQNNS